MSRYRIRLGDWNNLLVIWVGFLQAAVNQTFSDLADLQEPRHSRPEIAPSSARQRLDHVEDRSPAIAA
jgi:hypothetical protein